MKKKVVKKVKGKNNHEQKKEKRAYRREQLNDKGNMDTKPIIWTAVTVQTELETILTELLADPRINFVGQLFTKRPYSRHMLGYWRKEFKDEQKITLAISKIEEELESRAASGAITGTYNSNFTKFHLVNNHGWKDKQEVENEIKGSLTLSSLLLKAQKKEEENEE